MIAPCLRLADLTLDTAVEAVSGQISCDLGAETALLNLNTGMYYALNSVAARIWTLVSVRTTVACLRDTIVSEYRVTSHDCQRDLFEVLLQFADAGLIHVHAD